VALNPSDKLRAVARDNNWPTASFGSRGRPTLGQFIRSVAATVSLVPTFAAGLPIYALTGSRREATNFSITLFAETASALINLDLQGRGEENLWKSRPAVFVFNHQSKADVVIGAKLLRRDMAGVGKQEIKKMPVIGKVLEMGGVVMIDRKNAASAIEAMQPLVDAMRNEGRSVALAPEGTRTVSPNLGPFKKGRLPPGDAGRCAHGAGGYPQRRRRGAEGGLRVPPGHGGGRRAAAGGHQRTGPPKPSTSTCARCATCSCAPSASPRKPVSRQEAGSEGARRQLKSCQPKSEDQKGQPKRRQLKRPQQKKQR
jgi:1-acyl-sn-glycerol-3-phosphate acyltransferase